MRCFVAIPLPEAVRTALAEAGVTVRAAEPDWRADKWVARANLHITLVFLGEIARHDLQGLETAIEQEVARARSFELRFAAIRPVPSPRHVSMLWADYHDPDHSAASLAGSLRTAAARLGIQTDERPYSAHATLVRTRAQRRVDAETRRTLDGCEALVPEFVSVREVTLYRSTLTKAGPVYEALATWELRSSRP